MNQATCCLALLTTLSVASCSSSNDNPMMDAIGEGTTTGMGTTTSEGTTTTTESFNAGCHGDKPINIDGYLESIYSPRSLVFDSSNNDKFDFFKDAERIENYIDYRIGVSATYNLGSTSVSTDLSNVGSRIFRSTCNPPGRYSVGPVLTSLTITANLPIGENYPAGSELNEAFLIAPFERGDDANYPPTQAFVPNVALATTDYQPLSDFLQMEPMAPVAFLLRLEMQPTSTDEYVFSITYTLSTGLSGSAQVPGVFF